MAKPTYTKPTSQLDLEERQAKDYRNPSELIKGEDIGPSDNGFIGVDPVYQNFANETDKPLVGEKGAEAEIEKKYLSDDVDADKGATPEGESEAEDKDEKSTTTPSTSPSSTPPTGSNPS